jgi:hypothetical protein
MGAPFPTSSARKPALSLPKGGTRCRLNYPHPHRCSLQTTQNAGTTVEERRFSAA